MRTRIHTRNIPSLRGASAGYSQSPLTPPDFVDARAKVDALMPSHASIRFLIQWLINSQKTDSLWPVAMLCSSSSLSYWLQQKMLQVQRAALACLSPLSRLAAAASPRTASPPLDSQRQVLFVSHSGTRNRLNSIPKLLVALRAGLAPVVALLALFHPSPAGFGACLIAALLSDYFDGVIARRLGIATTALRRLDSAVDTLFFISVAFAVWHLYPEAVRDRWMPISVLVLLEACRYVLDFSKFRREASYHMWSSKLWALSLFAGFFSLLVFLSDGALVDLMIYLGILCDLEGVAISLVLRKWKSDVPTIFHAIKLRREQT